MALSRVIFEIFNVEQCCDLEMKVKLSHYYYYYLKVTQGH